MIFEFFRSIVRNPTLATKHARRLTAYHRAIRNFRKTHKACAWCGRTNRVDVHHIKPVSVAPELAEDENNMIMLCRKPQCHLVVGHQGSFRNRYVPNVRELCAARNVTQTTKNQG